VCLRTISIGAEVTTMSVKLDGKSMVSGHENGDVNLYDLESGIKLRSYRGHNEEVTSVQIKNWDSRN